MIDKCQKDREYNCWDCGRREFEYVMSDLNMRRACSECYKKGRYSYRLVLKAINNHDKESKIDSADI